MRKRTGKIIICKTCSESFYVRPSKSNQRYCSHVCRPPAILKQKRIKKNCLYCNKELTMLPYFSKRKKYCSRNCLAKFRFKGENNNKWKGEKVGYSGVHAWITRYSGKADRCMDIACEGKSKRYQWANISGEYKRDINDFVMLCQSCHGRFDFTEEKRQRIIRDNTGRIPWNKGLRFNSI